VSIELKFFHYKTGFVDIQSFCAEQWLFIALIFLWPSNLFLKFAESTGYLHGLLVDYLLPKLYVTDLLIVTLLAWWGVEWWNGRKKVSKERHTHTRDGRAFRLWLVVGIVAGILFAVQLHTPRPLAATWFLLKVMEMFGLAAWVVTHRSFFFQKIMTIALMAMLCFQSAVGLVQFTTQSSVFPSYRWLGESRLERRGGLARGTFEYVERVLPYGTTSHPNVLAAVLVIGLLALWTLPRLQQWLVPVVVSSVLAVITLALTQSWSAWLALVGGGGALWLYRFARTHHRVEELGKAILAGVLTAAVVIPFVVLRLAQTFPANPSFARRMMLNDAALSLWQELPLTGVGMDQFTVYVERASQNREVVRFVQPVHHVGLLMLSEIGILGIVLLLLVVAVFYRQLSARQRRSWWAVLPYVAIIFLPLASLDHYLWTQQVGQLTLVLGGGWIATNLIRQRT